jgi:tetratricopeptide (TPR) repeat protein/serine phosphatase RsbU (regulator of sigma subunit)
MNRKALLLTLLLLLLLKNVHAQQPVADSLLQLLDKTQADSSRIKILNRLASEVLGSAPQKTKQYAEEALQLSIKTGNFKGEASSYRNLGIYYYTIGDLAKANSNLFEAFKIYEASENEHNQAIILGNMCIVYQSQGNYAKALEGYFKALKIFEKKGSRQAMASCYNNIGLIYQEQKNYDLALDYYLKSLDLEIALNNELGIAGSFDNIGNIYTDKGDYKQALDYFNKSLYLYKKTNDKVGVASIYNNLGYSLSLNKDQQQAIQYYEKAVKISEEMGSKEILLSSLEGIGKCYYRLGEVRKAIPFYHKALNIAEVTGMRNKSQQCYEDLKDAYYALGQYQKAFLLQSKYISLKDSLFNEGSVKKMAQMQSLYESETKQVQIELLIKDKQIQEDEIKLQTILRNSFVGAFGFIGFIAFTLFRNNRSKNQVNKVLAEQNDKIELTYKALAIKNSEIQLQKEEIEAQRDNIEKQRSDLEVKNSLIAKKNDDITASIKYAQRIQAAMLPSLDKIKQVLPDSFVIFKPRDMVSGDFYWFRQVEDKIIIAAADCTGHGVPGGFMSMIGNDSLNEIVDKRNITEPDLILNELHQSIRKVLNQQETESRDGMDIVICVIDTPTKTLQYAGAMNPLFVIKQGELKVIQPNKTPIGGLQQEAARVFTKHTIDISQPTSIYLASDGYQDQFGGPNDKKFMVKRFKELLLQIHQLPADNQKQILENTLQDWMGEEKQIDDILVIGLNV